MRFGSGGDLLGVLRGCECDLVSERFELSDQALGEAIGVLPGAVGAAERLVLGDGAEVSGSGAIRRRWRGDGDHGVWVLAHISGTLDRASPTI